MPNKSFLTEDVTVSTIKGCLIHLGGELNKPLYMLFTNILTCSYASYVASITSNKK